MSDGLSQISDAIQSRPLDPNVVAVIPGVEEILSLEEHSVSAWARGFRIDVRHSDGEEKRYFMKVSLGYHGREALKGEYEATSAIYAITPEFCPKPIAWGTLKDLYDAHFYLCKFYDFHLDDELDPGLFCAQLANLHQSHTSPEGKFGFHCTTYNGNLPQDNTWSDSWEAFFDNGLRHVLKVREERAGPNAELDALLPALFEKVIPRLLRPLESNGRKIQPSLVHGDLWGGNAAVTNPESQEGIVFDPSSFWAHNEYELGNWRPHRNRFPSKFVKAYTSRYGASHPEDDFDDRNRLYAMRFNLHAATLFPDDPQYLQLAMDEMRALAEKYPDGYVEGAQADKYSLGSVVSS